MIKVISPDDAKCEIFESNRPVLVACLRKEEDGPAQVAGLETVSFRFGDRLKVCVADEFHLKHFFRRFGFGGTPFFLLIENGGERARFFGRADADELEGFVLDHINDAAGRA